MHELPNLVNTAIVAFEVLKTGNVGVSGSTGAVVQRSLLGLGIRLTFSRWGAEVNGGRLYARNLPAKGCVFTVDLPRAAALAPTVA